jgi:glutamyl-tRNA reductase
MHRIGVVGVSWRHHQPEALAAFTIPRAERAERLPGLALAMGVQELVYVATCNRVEVTFATDASLPISVVRRRVFAAFAGREPRAGEAEHTLRVWQGEGAAEHLFLVATGLDSAQVGEAEVAGQVRDAVEQSQTLGLLSPRLERVFGEALKAAKRVRPVTDACVGRVSLADVALRHVFERLARTPGRVALVGVSPMTERCARELASRGVEVVIVNRTLERAEALAESCAGESMSLDAFRDQPPGIEAIIASTGSPEPVLGRGDLERIAARAPSGESPLVIDLALPPNVTPEDAAAADVPRLGMNEINEEAAHDRERLLLEVADARAIVDEALTALRRQAAERLVGPLIAQLRLRYRHTALEGIERLFERDLAGLGESEREAIRRWAETLARRFAHVPSVGLRDLAFQVGPGAVEAFFASAEPELALALRTAADPADAGLIGELEDA